MTEPETGSGCSDSVRTSELVEGRCTFDDLDLGLQIHTNDAVELQSANASFVVAPAVTVALMLEGDLDASLDGQPLAMTAQRGPRGYLWINRHPAVLERWLRAGQRVRKVNVSVPLSVLPAKSDAFQDSALASFLDTSNDLVIIQWQPSVQALRSAEDILTLDPEKDALERLSCGIAALAIVRSALSQLVDVDGLHKMPPISTRDVTRARHARDFVLGNMHEPLQITEIAQGTGMSVSTLQRVFKRCFGMTVIEFVRARKLELARFSLSEGGMTVGEAAYQAGYSSTANFSTAFQREFGYPPSSCIHT